MYSTCSLAAGAHSITAAYSGDYNFASSASSAIAVTVQDFGLTHASTSPGGETQTVEQPRTLWQLARPPARRSPAAIALSVSGLPPGATATITPQVPPAGSGLTNVTLTIVLAQPAVALGGDDPLGGQLPSMLLGLLVLPLTMRIRRPGVRFARMVWMLFLALVGCGLGAGLSGCGSPGSRYFGQPQQSYSVMITATSGSISRSTTVTLIVQ